jgi:hypothetical protein
MFENCEFLIVLTTSVYPVQRVQTDHAGRPKTVGLEGPMDQPTSHSKTKERHITFRFVACISQDSNREPSDTNVTVTIKF